MRKILKPNENRSGFWGLLSIIDSGVGAEAAVVPALLAGTESESKSARPNGEKGEHVTAAKG